MLNGGSESMLKRSPRGPSCMLNRSRYTGDGHNYYDIGPTRIRCHRYCLMCMCVGVVFFGGGFAKRGVRPNPRTPWLRDWCFVILTKLAN